MSPAVKQEVDKWWMILLRHGTTVGLMLTALWWLAAPRVELFIKDTVNDRIEIIENQLDIMQRQLTELQIELDKVVKKP